MKMDKRFVRIFGLLEEVDDYFFRIDNASYYSGIRWDANEEVKPLHKAPDVLFITLITG